MTEDTLFNDFKRLPYYVKIYEIQINNKTNKLEVSFNIIGRHLPHQQLYYLIQRYNLYSIGGRKLNLNLCPVTLPQPIQLELTEEIITLLKTGNIRQDRENIIRTLYKHEFDILDNLFPEFVTN